MADLIKLSIDGMEVEVPPGSTIIQAASKSGKMIPHFCYHPGLSVVGQCRMCFVEIEGAPKLATACSTPVAANMKVLTASEKVKAGQNATLEFTLLNHPLDCPICDRGGECKLQDYTYDYGPPLSRMGEDKVLRDKHKPVSEQVVLDQERCILCTRCVRFSSEVDGRTELVVNERGNAGVIDVFEDRPMKSVFSGNVVDLCPVGALTAKDYRFAARPWELEKHESLCTGCSVGCNVEIHTKHRHPGIVRPDKSLPRPELVRLMPRENLAVNEWWMCDKGRWGYHFHNNDTERLTQVLGRRTQKLESMSLKEIQVQIDQAAGEWSFWIADSVAHEGISWVKELVASWKSRGRNVNAEINSSPWAKEFLRVWAGKSASPWFAGAADWSSVETVVAPFAHYRDLESIVPILSLKIGSRVRQGKLKWVHRPEAQPHTQTMSGEDLAKTAFLVPVPKNQDDLKHLEALPAAAKVLILWTQANSRGLLNEGIVPLEAQAHWLSNNRAQGPMFIVHQRTQNSSSGEAGFKEFQQYAASSRFRVVADSFATPLSETAHAVLPLAPLYESAISLTSLENHRQHGKGIKIHHPNEAYLERGASFVSPALKLL
jgi:NADH dehydrogenase/NADH:ubiquinone oxidoreductase subunit G